MSLEAQAYKSSLEEVWYLKDIRYNGKELKIVTQNFNGYVRPRFIVELIFLTRNL